MSSHESPVPGPRPAAPGAAVPVPAAPSAAPARATAPVPAAPSEATPAGATGAFADEESLLDRVELIEAQPLAARAAGFEQLHDELLTELQRGDLGDA